MSLVHVNRKLAMDNTDKYGLEPELHSRVNSPLWPGQDAACSIGNVKAVKHILRCHKERSTPTLDVVIDRCVPDCVARNKSGLSARVYRIDAVQIIGELRSDIDSFDKGIQPARMSVAGAGGQQMFGRIGKAIAGHANGRC